MYTKNLNGHSELTYKLIQINVKLNVPDDFILFYFYCD